MNTVIKKTQTDKDDNLVLKLWFKYFPFWPVFLALVLVAGTGAYFYIKRMTPLYEASASVLIKDEKKGADESKMIEELNQLSSKKIIENEMEVLKSRALMHDVVKNLRLYVGIIDKKTGRTAYNEAPVLIEVANPDSIRPTLAPQEFTVNQSKGTFHWLGKDYPLNEWFNSSYGKLRFTSVPQFNSSKVFAFEINDARTVADILVKGLVVTSASKLATVINLKIRDESPKRAEDILNHLLGAYNNAAIKDKSIVAGSTLASVDERLKIVYRDLDSIQKKLESYKSTSGAVDISSQGQLFLKNVSENDQKLSDINSQLAALGQVEKYVRSKENGSSIVPSTIGVSDPQLIQMIEKLSTTELERERMKTTYGNENPLTKSVDDQIDKLRPGILDNISSQRNNLEASKLNISSTNNQYSTVLQAIPQKEKDMIEITREQGIKSSIYNFLLQKKEEAALSLASATAESRTIDSAESTRQPVSPNKKLYFIMALVLALAIGVGLIAANELFTKTVLFRKDIESLTHAPIVAEIMFDKSGESLVIGKNKRTFIAEQFRKLRTSLSSLGLGNKKKTILVTSTVSGDGKSFIVANLGLSLALVDKKVVLVELDLVNPTLSEKLELFNATKGVTDFLNESAEPEEIIRRSPVNENLFVISAGELPDDPSELIAKGRIPELIEYLKSIFDYVIIDSAPAGLMTDAYTLTHFCDATLYVVRHKHTPKRMIKQMDEEADINSLKNLSIVFNGVKSRGFTSMKSGYGYGYGYGNTYGYTYEKKNARKRKLSLAKK